MGKKYGNDPALTMGGGVAFYSAASPTSDSQTPRREWKKLRCAPRKPANLLEPFPGFYCDLRYLRGFNPCLYIQVVTRAPQCSNFLRRAYMRRHNTKRDRNLNHAGGDRSTSKTFSLENFSLPSRVSPIEFSYDVATNVLS